MGEIINHIRTAHKDLSPEDAVISITDKLSSNPKLNSCFNDTEFRIAAYTTSTFNLKDIAQRLYNSVAIGLETEHLKEYFYYFDLKSVTYVEHQGVGGIKVERAHDIGDSLTLLPREMVPANAHGLSPIGTFLGALIFCEAFIVRTHVISATSFKRKDRKKNNFKDRDLVSHLSVLPVLFGNYKPFESYNWCERITPITELGSSCRGGLSEGAVSHNSVLHENDLTNNLALINKFIDLPIGDRSRLSLVLTRLSDSERRYKGVSRAVDLGIAYESFFIHQKALPYPPKSEPLYIFKILGMELKSEQLSITKQIINGYCDLMDLKGKKKKEARKILRCFYEIRSAAVHTGRIPEGRDNKKYLDLARDMLKKAVTKYILSN